VNRRTAGEGYLLMERQLNSGEAHPMRLVPVCPPVADWVELLQFAAVAFAGCAVDIAALAIRLAERNGWDPRFAIRCFLLVENCLAIRRCFLLVENCLAIRRTCRLVGNFLAIRRFLSVESCPERRRHQWAGIRLLEF
jgi:hypothetical protein